MSLLPEDVNQFYRLHKALMLFVNQRLQVIEEKPASTEEYEHLAPEVRMKVHKALLEHMDLIDAFADENPFHFDESDLEIVRSWKHLVAGTFYAFRQLQNHMVFLSAREPIVAYGVLPLFDPFEVVIGPYLPRMLETTLLPFKGQIVYDGLISGFNITFGGGIKRMLNESYKKAKQRSGIVTSLPPSDGKPQPDEPRAAVMKRATGRTDGAGRFLSPGNRACGPRSDRGPDRRLLQEIPRRRVRGLVPETGGIPGPQAAVAADPRQARVLGRRDRARRRLGELHRRPQPAQPHASVGRSTSGSASPRPPGRPSRSRSGSCSRSAGSTRSGRCPAGWTRTRWPG